MKAKALKALAAMLAASLALAACSLIPLPYPQLWGDAVCGIDLTYEGSNKLVYRDEYHSKGLSYNSSKGFYYTSFFVSDKLIPGTTCGDFTLVLPSLAPGTYGMASFPAGVAPCSLQIGTTGYAASQMSLVIAGNDGTYVWGSFDATISYDPYIGSGDEIHRSLSGVFAMLY